MYDFQKPLKKIYNIKEIMNTSPIMVCIHSKFAISEVRSIMDPGFSIAPEALCAAGDKIPNENESERKAHSQL